MNILSITENEEALLPKLSNSENIGETKKRKTSEENDATKKPKLESTEEVKSSQEVSPIEETNGHSVASTSSVLKPHKGPKKRLNISGPISTPQKFFYGNYCKYYGYRNKDIHDIRLDVFEKVRHVFAYKDVLDIGCNSGMITIEIAKEFDVRHITGIDIDKGLINRVNKTVSKSKKSVDATKTNENKFIFPFNITFVHGNYILRDDVLLEIEKEQFDLILCLSVTKWIHLNFGDAGLKQSFRRMFRQLRPGGHLILEPQPWDGYKRRKKLTPEIFTNYQSIRFKPQDFTSYLLSDEVGFKAVTLLAVPDHNAEGFRRPIQMFTKSD